MKSVDTTIRKDNISETMQRAVEVSRMNVREAEFQAEKAKQEEQELEHQLREAEVAKEQKEEAAENGQETERKIAEVAGG